MLELEYTTTLDEATDATMNFLSNRPSLAIMFLLMRISCFFLCFAFTIAFYHKAVRPQDYVTVFTATTWIFYYKQITRFVIKTALKRRKFFNIKCTMKIDEKSILYHFQDYAPQHIEWKKLKFVLKNKNGYIIPLTGLANSGKFMWLPLHSLNQNDEQTFLNFVNKYKLKIKKSR